MNIILDGTLGTSTVIIQINTLIGTKWEETRPVLQNKDNKTKGEKLYLSNKHLQNCAIVAPLQRQRKKTRVS